MIEDLTNRIILPRNKEGTQYIKLSIVNTLRSAIVKYGKILANGLEEIWKSKANTISTSCKSSQLSSNVNRKVITNSKSVDLHPGSKQISIQNAFANSHKVSSSQTIERPIRSTRNLTINYNEDEPIRTVKQRLKIFHDTDTYANKRMYISKSDIPGHTGYGGFANRRLKRHEIIGEYKGGPRITLRNKNKTALSSYAFEDAQNKRIVDPYDPITGEVACSAARINDNIQDPSRWNCEFHIKGKKIFIRATREIQEDEELYLPYGALYWCDPQYPLDILILAQQAYGKQND